VRTSAVAVTALAMLGLALGACGNGDGDTEGDTPGPPAETTPPGSPQATGQVASCLVGQWQSTGVTEQDGDGVVDVTLSGGEGAVLTIDDDGTTNLDLSQSGPIEVAGSVAGLDVAGTLQYTGQGTAVLETDSDADSGSWQPTETDWGDVRVTLDLTEPTEGRPLDEAPIGDAIEGADEWTGDVVDVNPVLGDGEYQCQNGELEVTAGSPATTWTFTQQ
jgi:hypothetical protein